MSYVRKMGASALVVAAAFAVAFAVLVSSTSNDTAEAATVQLPAADGSVQAAPGDTVQIVVAGALAQLSITGTADGVGASFAANNGQSISCGDNAACDTDDSDAVAAGRQNVADSVRVSLKIDDDAGEGHILVSVEGVGLASGNTARVTKVINVSKATLVGSLAIKTDAASDKTIAAAAGTSNLTATVKNASTPAEGLEGQSVTIITTHGTVGCATTGASAGTTQTCSADSGADGTVDIVLTGGGVEGTATVTARLGTRTATASVTLFGSAKNLEATPDQSSVEIGGTIFVVLKLTDGAGNAVSGVSPTAPSTKAIVGPSTSATLVATDFNMDKDKNKNRKVDTGDIPACGNHENATGGETSTNLTSDGTDAGTDVAAGTNADGECVVQVSAPKASGDQKAATRGLHTLNFQATGTGVTGTLKAAAMIEVAGAPASITTNAADRVDTESSTEITVSVWDDEDVLVGITSVKVRKVGGDGLIEDNAGAKDADNNAIPDTEKTVNGQSKFTLIAPSDPGSIEILITAGKAEPHRLTIHFGEEVEEPAPPAHVPALSPSPASTTLALVTFNGGSVADLAGVLAAECGDGARVYATDYQSTWVQYIPGAPAAVNRGFNALFAEGIEAGRALLVTNCGG